MPASQSMVLKNKLRWQISINRTRELEETLLDGGRLYLFFKYIYTCVGSFDVLAKCSDDNDDPQTFAGSSK